MEAVILGKIARDSSDLALGLLLGGVVALVLLSFM